MRNLKRALSLALAAVMVLGMMVIGAGAVSVDDFSDGADIVNKEAVTVLASLNVINGKDDGSYDPTGIVTRAEMAKMICVVLNGGRDPQLGAVVSDSYTDTVNHWAKAYIEYCTNLGIVAGRGDGTFAPNDTVTMAEAAKMLLVAIGYNADIEGYVGANWQINTDVKANQEDLYEGITATNTSVDLTRDNAAQMVYNALECQMVKYEYVVTTDGSVVTTKPQVTTAGLGNVLEEKFNAVKVEAIVEGNEYATVNSNNYASSEDAGETYLNVVSISNSKQVNSSVPQDEEWKSADGIYDVSTDKDLLGQRVVVYVRYKDTVGYDEQDALVIGDPIPVSSNKVVTSTDGTNADDLADDNKLELTADTVYLVNYGGYYGGVVYGGDPADTTVATADVDNDVTSMTKAQFNAAAECVGTTVTLIDNDGDKKVDYALAEKYSYGTVNKYTTGDDSALRVQGFFNEDEYKAENVVGFDNVALNDLVLFTEYGGKVYVQKPETVEAKLDNYSTSKKNVTLDGETIKWSGLNGRTPAEVIWVGDYVTSEGVLNTTANYYKDNNGYVFAAGETDESLLTYAVLLGYENQTKSGTGLGTTARAKLLLADGTVGTFDVATIGGKAVTNCTEPTDPSKPGTTSSGVSSKENYSKGEIGFSTADLYTIYSYSKNDAGAMRLVKKTEAHIDGTASTPAAENVKFTNGTSNISFGNTAAAPMDDGSATVTERTIFLYERKDGTFSRYVGRTAPGIVYGTADYNLKKDETFSIRVSTSGEALVVFMGNVDPVSEWKDNWAFVYNTKVAQNGDAYLVQAIIDGKAGEYLVEQAYDASGTEVITRDELGDRIYGHKIPYGLYNFTEDDGVYTLTQVHLDPLVGDGYNVRGVIVDSFRSSYIRAANHSYTITADTQMFEARENKSVQSITSVNQGDKVTIVYNDDNEAVYIFLNEFSYNIISSGYTPVISATSADKALDTDGGVVGSVTLGSFTQNNVKYQWYKSTDDANDTSADDVALTDSMGYTGSTTAALSVNKGTLAADTTYYFYCVVTNTDLNGVSAPATSDVITITTSAAPVAGALRVTFDSSDLNNCTVVVNNAPVTLTSVGTNGKWATGISKGDTVEIVADEFTVGTYWTVDGIADPVKVTTANVLKFTMPNCDVNIATADQVVKYTLGTGVTLSGTGYDAATGFAPVGTQVTITVDSANGTGVIVSDDRSVKFAATGSGAIGDAIATGGTFTPAGTEGDIYMDGAATLTTSLTITAPAGAATTNYILVGTDVTITDTNVVASQAQTITLSPAVEGAVITPSSDPGADGTFEVAATATFKMPAANVTATSGNA